MSRLCVLLALFIVATFAHSQQLVDPTTPKYHIKSAETSDGLMVDGFPVIKVSAVFINQNAKVAIVNGQSVTEGTDWNGMLISKVHRDGVVLVNNENVKKEFLINNDNVKKDASNDF